MSERAGGRRWAAAAVLGALAALAALPVPASGAPPQVLRQDDRVAGRTVSAWLEPYSRWLLDLADPRDCRKGQRGRMFFLPASTGGSERATCTVPPGKPVILSPAGVTCIRSGLSFCLAPARRREAVQVGVKIDGAPLRIRPADWISRRGFRIGRDRAATAGYYYVLRGLAAGPHTIVLFVRYQAPDEPVFRARMTVRLTVG